MLNYNNSNQRENVTQITKDLHKKGYSFTLRNNFQNNAVIIQIKPSLNLSGSILVFDNGTIKNELYHTKGSYNSVRELPLCS